MIAKRIKASATQAAIVMILLPQGEGEQSQTSGSVVKLNGRSEITLLASSKRSAGIKIVHQVPGAGDGSTGIAVRIPETDSSCR